LVLDQATLNRVIVRGIPAELMGKTLSKNEGSLMDYVIWWVFAQQSLKMNDVTGSFYIDIT
jgi:hypothetical protein